MKFTLEASLPQFDAIKYYRIFIEFVNRSARKAVRNYLNAIRAFIPVDTGFLLGSYRALAQDFGASTSVGGRFRNTYYRHTDRTLYSKTNSGAPDLLTQPEQVITLTGTKFTISIANPIRYYLINDVNRRGRGTPWLSLSRALAILTNTLELELNRLPDPLQLITQINISYDGSTIKTSRNFNLRGGI